MDAFDEENRCPRKTSSTPIRILTLIRRPQFLSWKGGLAKLNEADCRYQVLTYLRSSSSLQSIYQEDRERGVHVIDTERCEMEHGPERDMRQVAIINSILEAYRSAGPVKSCNERLTSRNW